MWYGKLLRDTKKKNILWHVKKMLLHGICKLSTTKSFPPSNLSHLSKRTITAIALTENLFFFLSLMPSVFLWIYSPKHMFIKIINYLLFNCFCPFFLATNTWHHTKSCRIGRVPWPTCRPHYQMPTLQQKKLNTLGFYGNVASHLLSDRGTVFLISKLKRLNLQHITSNSLTKTSKLT